MSELLKKLKKRLNKKSPIDRLLKGEFTEKDKEKYLIHYKKDKAKRK
jgi:hypothetical protein